MANSACGRASILLQPASNDDVLREREAYKYFQPLQDLLRASKTPSAPDRPFSSPDRALTAFAQLGAFRLGVRRAFVSLIDRKHQYVLAEATKTLSLEKNTVDDERDNLWIGATQFERQATPCEYAAGLLIAPDFMVGEDEQGVVVFPDLSQHPLFKSHALVTEKPHGRFYAGVPIISTSGHNIGVFCVLDDTPREQGLSATEIDFMKDMAKTIMGHLEMVRATVNLNRSQNMVQGLGQFVDGKANLKEWWDNFTQRQPGHAQSRAEYDRAGHHEARTSNSFAKHMRPAYTSSGLSDANPAPAVGFRHSNFEASHSASIAPEANSAPFKKAAVGNQLQEDSISSDIKPTFQRAAEIIRESVDVDGAIFLDASIGTFAGLVDETEEKDNSVTETSTSTGTWTTSDRVNESLQVPEDKRCIVLGSSLASADKLRTDHIAEQSPALSVSERFLQKLLAKYPRGKIWNYDVEDSSVYEGIVDSPRTIDSINRRGERWRERWTIQNLFPGARSLALVGMWDPHRSRWYAGSIIWTYNPTRILSADSELNYMVAFGQSIMAEIARIDVKMADKAKATFISSISHELRTPLHGIMGSSECLQGTPLDAFQSGLINTIETCGKTLLDTFDNLLSFAKINNLTNSSTYRRPSIPSIRIDKYRNGIDSVQSRVDLSILTAEVVDTAFAGNEFVRVTPLRTGMANGGNVSAHSETGLDAITVLLDYDTTTDWVFATQAGAWIRIILNLVGNSLKYTERGRVTVRLGQRLLPNPLSEDDVEVTLTVSDTGCGMSEDFIAQSIFSPFVQEDSLSPGTGLGLSIVKQIITSMGGTISVESKKDQGTTFSVAVCMTRDNSAAELEKPSSLSAVAAILPDKRFNMIIPEGEHDETNFVNLCSSWFSVPILCTPEPVEAADVYFVLKRHVSGLKRQLASRSAHVNTIGKKPVIILCKDVFSAESLRSSKSLAAVIPRTEFLSQPLAPTKIAKILIQCFERPTYKKSDSNSTIIRPVSRSSSISSQRPRMHRLASDVSQISSPSNPEVMVFTPMEEKTKEALLFRVNASVEAVRQAEVLEAQKQASLPHFHNASSAPCVSVLLVDDNSINLNLLAMFMRKQRHAYDTATNGLEAFKAYQAYSDPTRVLEDSRNSLTLQQATSLTAKSFDFVLMDLNMPVMDGLESTRQIRAFERAKGLRPAIIVALTGMSSASAQQEAFASGVDLFLTKPVRLKELTKIFEQNTRQFF